MKAHDYPVETAVMRAQDLTFPDNYFTHSFTNFVIAGLDDVDVASKHLYRTLKPGGIATVCTWAEMVHTEPLSTAHSASRGLDAKLALDWGGAMVLQSWLKDFLIVGGFDGKKVEITTCNVFLKVKDIRHWATITWSFLGERKDGWHQEDEDKWDQVIDIIVGEIKKSPNCKELEDGNELKFTANIARAVK